MVYDKLLEIPSQSRDQRLRNRVFTWSRLGTVGMCISRAHLTTCMWYVWLATCVNVRVSRHTRDPITWYKDAHIALYLLRTHSLTRFPHARTHIFEVLWSHKLRAALSNVPEHGLNSATRVTGGKECTVWFCLFLTFYPCDVSSSQTRLGWSRGLALGADFRNCYGARAFIPFRFNFIPLV